MYVDAVKLVLDKLADSKVKNSVKADLKAQLRELDPEGKIRTYIAGGEAGTLDLLDTIATNRAKAAAKKGAASSKAPRGNTASSRKDDDSSSDPSSAGSKGGERGSTHASSTAKSSDRTKLDEVAY
jgi:hypothetical protein